MFADHEITMDERYLFFLRYYLTMLKQVYYVLAYTLSHSQSNTRIDSLFFSVFVYMLFTVIALCLSVGYVCMYVCVCVYHSRSLSISYVEYALA